MAEKRDHPVTYITSADGKTWSKPAEIPNTVSEHGAQLISFNGRLHGVVTSSSKNSDHLIFAGKYDKKNGFDLYKADNKFRAQGRVSVATLDDRFYILYRGTNNGVYLIYSTDGFNWRDLGRIGSKYSETHESPAIHAFGKKLLLVGVGADKIPYYTITDKDGKREGSWAKVNVKSPKTSGSLALVPVAVQLGPGEDPYYVLRLYRRADEFQRYSINEFEADEKDHYWSQSTQPLALSPNGVAATAYGKGKYLVSYLDYFSRLNLQLLDDTEPFPENPQIVAIHGAYNSETGIAVHNGEIVISYATEEPEEDLKRAMATAYKAPTALDEKKALAEADAWDCKWQEPEANKTDTKSLIRGCFCL